MIYLNLNQKAIKFLEENLYDKALQCFREAVSVSREVQSLNNLAWFLSHEEDDYPAAFELLKEAVAMNPSSYFPYSMLGEVCLRLERWENARIALEKAIALHPTKEVYHNLGVAHYHLGNKEDAAQFFLLGSESSDFGLCFHIKCLIELGRAGEAKLVLDTFSEEDEEFIGEVDFADIYLEMGCLKEANQWFEKGWEVYAKDPKWISRWVYCFVQADNPDRASEILLEVLEERREQLEEAYTGTTVEEWNEEDKEWYICDLLSDIEAFQRILEQFPPNLPPMDFETYCKTRCYLFGCGRHGHPEYS